MLTLYKVGTRGRIALEDLVTDGDFYTAEKDEDGKVVLSPVQVNTTGGKKATGQGDTDTPPFS